MFLDNLVSLNQVQAERYIPEVVDPVRDEADHVPVIQPHVESPPAHTVHPAGVVVPAQT